MATAAPNDGGVINRFGDVPTESLELTLQRTILPFIANAPIIIVGVGAPNNADGRPNGTIYIQTS